MSKADSKHYIARLVVTDNHVPQKTGILTYVIELQMMLQGIILNEKPDFVGRFRLQPAMLDVEYLVEKSAYMESQTGLFLRSQSIRILVVIYPSLAGECEFQLVTIIFDVF